MPENIVKRIVVVLARWTDTWSDGEPDPSIIQNWLRLLRFITIHVRCVGVIWVGWSPVALAVAIAMYLVRMFAITGFYHRYFSHRTFKTSRAAQFIFAIAGSSAAQRGPLWWAAHHRLHHQRADGLADVHSPVQHGFLWSHVGWIVSETNFATHWKTVRDLACFPELKFLDRYHALVPTGTGVAMYGLGATLAHFFPDLHTSGGQMLVWGFFISTTTLAHGTFTINSLAHMFGRRRYDTNDNSRNSFMLAMITLGEGWHNNHHRYPASVRQGLFWWEIDVTYYVLKVLSLFGIIWDLRQVPGHLLDEGGRVRAMRTGTDAIKTVIRKARPKISVVDEEVSD